MTTGNPIVPHRPTVLFICIHNAGRSQMAEAFATDIARRHSLPLLFRSAGTEPRDNVNSAVVDAMSEIGISMTGRVPHLLKREEVDGADQVITMGCGLTPETCPVPLGTAEDWPIEDPADQPIEKVRLIRDEIRWRVESLIVAMTRDLGVEADREALR